MEIAALLHAKDGRLDVDIGGRSQLNSSVMARQWLLGITFRGAP